MHILHMQSEKSTIAAMEAPYRVITYPTSLGHLFSSLLRNSRGSF